jgi:hypothetical protein
MRSLAIREYARRQKKRSKKKATLKRVAAVKTNCQGGER